MAEEKMTELAAGEALITHGHATVRTQIDHQTLTLLANSLFTLGEAGARCLLDVSLVAEVARAVRSELVKASLLPETAVAVQAIAFDKTPEANWKVTWHQDLMFPFADKIIDATYSLPCVKDGIHFARPPKNVLEEMLAVRIHIDDCDEFNGPLRVSPCSHRLGILRSSDIPSTVERLGETTCLVEKGAALLMRPLLLHALSQAVHAKHRRVLHLVYHSGNSVSETWHRSLR